MAAANHDLVEGQFGDGCGKLDWHGAEADAGCAVCLLDVVDGEPEDCSGSLDVEEQQQAGEAVFGLLRVLLCSRWWVVAQRASSSTGWEGPFPRSAGKVRSRAIFCEKAQRTKWPACY
ncbi:hypothetical protein [Streptomyces celluloflavus]|uniref:hypothetical protein n=1 Tax=Streptomyces celluloflavus TaxID=58344 RepID=UPI00364CB1BA